MGPQDSRDALTPWQTAMLLVFGSTYDLLRALWAFARTVPEDPDGRETLLELLVAPAVQVGGGGIFVLIVSCLLSRRRVALRIQPGIAPVRGRRMGMPLLGLAAARTRRCSDSPLLGLAAIPIVGVLIYSPCTAVLAAGIWVAFAAAATVAGALAGDTHQPTPAHTGEMSESDVDAPGTGHGAG